MIHIYSDSFPPTNQGRVKFECQLQNCNCLFLDDEQVRLRFTFHNSAYAISKSLYFSIKLIYWVMILDVVVSLAIIAYANQTDNDELMTFMENTPIFIGIFFFLYLGLSGWTVTVFGYKIFHIASSCTSPTEQSISTTKAVILSNQQDKFVEMGSKFGRYLLHYDRYTFIFEQYFQF